MTERQLLDLGFEKQEQNDDVEDYYYYYILTIAQGLEFITNTNDETDHEDDWCVDFFNSNPTIRWTNAEDFRLLLEFINKGERL